LLEEAPRNDMRQHDPGGRRSGVYSEVGM